MEYSSHRSFSKQSVDSIFILTKCFFFKLGHRIQHWTNNKTTNICKLEFTHFDSVPIPANTVRNITFVKVPFSSFMDERNEDVLRT